MARSCKTKVLKSKFFAETSLPLGHKIWSTTFKEGFHFEDWYPFHMQNHTKPSIFDVAASSIFERSKWSSLVSLLCMLNSQKHKDYEWPQSTGTFRWEMLSAYALFVRNTSAIFACLNNHSWNTSPIENPPPTSKARGFSWKIPKNGLKNHQCSHLPLLSIILSCDHISYGRVSLGRFHPEGKGSSTQSILIWPCIGGWNDFSMVSTKVKIKDFEGLIGSQIHSLYGAHGRHTKIHYSIHRKNLRVYLQKRFFLKFICQIWGKPIFWPLSSSANLCGLGQYS